MATLRGFVFVCAILMPLCSAAQDEFAIEVGPNFVLGDYSESGTLLVQRRWNNKYAVGIGYISQQCLENEVINLDCEWDIPPMLMFGGDYRFSWRKWVFSVGLYYVNDKNRISSSYINARTALEYQFNDSFDLKFSHMSNGGTGEDLEVCNVNNYCITGTHNMGINVLALVWKFR